MSKVRDQRNPALTLCDLHLVHAGAAPASVMVAI